MAQDPLLPIGLLRKRVIAQQCSVSLRTIDNWVAAGKIPCIRIGRVTRFDPAAVREALQRYTVEAK
jgi:excisionase family DNA binding protein